MARKLQVALLLVSALAVMSLTLCSAQDDQTLASEVGRRALLAKAKAEEPKPQKGEATTGLPKTGGKDNRSHSGCYDRAGCDICTVWKHKGYCGAYTYKGYSVPYFWCQQTCCTCSKCVDLYPKTCYQWKCKGYCAPHYFYNGYSVYKTICPRTCGYCH